MKPVELPRASYQFNEDANYNFQLNRVVQWDGGRAEDVQRVGARIKNAADWKRELIALGDEAQAEGRIGNAIAYYRMSEFFMTDGDPDKLKYYRLASDMFYRFYAAYFADGTVERMEAPYEDISLPVLHAKAQGVKRDVILLHGGNDSYMEELFFPMLYLAQHGFEVYLFEGPGQGGVVRVQGKKFTHEWEKPVKAVLDAVGEENVTIMGASLGGMLAPRAAAFEPRVRRVVGWSVFPNFLYVGLNAVPKALHGPVRFMVRHNMSGVMNAFLRAKMKRVPGLDWGIRHGMYAYDAKDPFGYVKKLNDYQMVNVGPRIEQDVLIIGANRDHFIPSELYSMEIDALPNARSLTYRLMTEKEDAGAHCNVGNPKLVLDTVMDWIDGLKRRDGEGIE